MIRRVLAGGITAVLGSALGLAVSTPASAAPALAGSSPNALPAAQHLRPMYDVGVHSNLRLAAAPVPNSIPNFAATINDHGTTFSYKMAGKSPQLAGAGSTTVKTMLIPLKIVLGGGLGTHDASVGDSCDATSASARTAASPIFVNKPFSFGGTSVGTTQYVDAYQRANFWKYAKPGALNPGYHVLLGKNVLPVQTINVPASASASGGAACGTLGAVEINWLDGYLQNTLIPRLAGAGVNSTTFPMFLTENVVEYINTTANCCVLGFHNAYSSTGTGGKVQTYGISMYDNSGDFTGSSDISVLTHEVGEWMDDPFVDNATKPWGHIGQVNGCQANLENGDPLSGTIKPVVVGAKTYHVQELAFLSWFFHQSPSIGIHGWYSNYGKFRTPAAACV